MLLILHGDNTVQSRNALNQEIAKAKQAGIKDILRLDGKKIDLTELQQATGSQSLFGTNRLIIIESLHSNPSKSKLKLVIDFLSTINHQPSTISLWEPKALTPTQLKKLSNFKTQIFKTSLIVFSFLDSLQPNKAIDFNQLHHIFEQDSAEFFYFMLVRQTKLLLQSIDGKPATAPWKIAKLKKQATNFGSTKLLWLHHQLLEIDYKLKTGQLPLNLAFELERLLIKLTSA